MMRSLRSFALVWITVSRLRKPCWIQPPGALEDIDNFADVFTTCKRSGGDLVEVVRRTSNLIGEKLEISQEIGVMIAQKRFEAKAMLAAPVLFLLFMQMTSPDYMRPLHHGSGLLISGLALLLFAVCAWLMLKIIDIRI
ncbi:hypothetical protein HMSSN139_07420 [Paenibacillus sp. HMSSN-139]|nr:hypothetical protein HMSSN139_07420 [Paenibacillus sp. HMSSN-139]